MSWGDALTTAETAAIWWAVPAVLVVAVAKVKLLPLWRRHKSNQQAILANQKTILGERFERPTT